MHLLSNRGKLHIDLVLNSGKQSHNLSRERLQSLTQTCISHYSGSYIKDTTPVQRQLCEAGALGSFTIETNLGSYLELCVMRLPLQNLVQT